MAGASSGARWWTATSSTIGRHTLFFLDTVSAPHSPPTPAALTEHGRPVACGAAMAADTIAVLSLKGGTGKTTTVRTLADVLRRIGLDVLAIDLDPQGNLSDYFDVPPDAAPSIADVLSGDAKVKDGDLRRHRPRDAQSRRGRARLSGKMGREVVLKKALKDARSSTT